MNNKVEKTNEIEHAAEPTVKVGEVVEVTNPIVVYSDVPGSGPDDAQVPKVDTADVAGGKALAAPPQNKAVAGPKGTK